MSDILWNIRYFGGLICGLIYFILTSITAFSFISSVWTGFSLSMLFMAGFLYLLIVGFPIIVGVLAFLLLMRVTDEYDLSVIGSVVVGIGVAYFMVAHFIKDKTGFSVTGMVWDIITFVFHIIFSVIKFIFGLFI